MTKQTKDIVVGDRFKITPENDNYDDVVFSVLNINKLTEHEWRLEINVEENPSGTVLTSEWDVNITVPLDGNGLIPLGPRIQTQKDLAELWSIT